MLEFKGKLGIEDFYKVIFKNEPIQIDKAVLETVENSFNFLKSFPKTKSYMVSIQVLDLWHNIKLKIQSVFNYNII